MLHAKNGLDLFQIWLNASSGKHESEKLVGCDTENILAWIQLYLMLMKCIEGFFHVFDVVGLFGALDEHVVNVDLHILTNLVFENLIDQSLIDSSCIFQIKRCYFITINTFFDDERCILLILGSHPYLAIA